jgi:hypothetical protein
MVVRGAGSVGLVDLSGEQGRYGLQELIARYPEEISRLP